MPIALATCPYKDEANDYAIRDDDARDDNAVWTYEHAKGDVGEIAAHLASYPNQIQIVRAVSPMRHDASASRQRGGDQAGRLRRAIVASGGRPHEGVIDEKCHRRLSERL